MQNQNVKYVKTIDSKLYTLFIEKENLVTYEYIPNHSRPYKTICTGISNFSVAHFNGVTYITYLKKDNNIYTATTKDFIEFEHNQSEKSTHNINQNSKITLIPTETDCYMIYNSKSDYQNMNNLFYSKYHKGIWSEPIFIDRIVINNQNTTPYFFRRINEDHIVLYYKKNNNMWLSKEILLDTKEQSNSSMLIQNNNPCVDISIVNTKEKIHILYITKSMFRSQIIYQYKQTHSVSPPRILWESNNCSNCLAYLENSELTLLWQSNNTLMICQSQNEGGTFTPIRRYNNYYPNRIIKSEFYEYPYKDFNSTEIYTDLEKGFIPFAPTEFI